MSLYKNRFEKINFESYKSLRELVADILRKSIRNGVLKPGERLMEDYLAEELGISRTPVREALRKLEQEGLVEVIPRRGASVSIISLRDIEEVFEIRNVLESLAVRLVVKTITKEKIKEFKRLEKVFTKAIEAGDYNKIVQADTLFHNALYDASGNHRLKEILNNLSGQLIRFRNITLHYPGRAEKTSEENHMLIEAIEKGDIKLAEKVILLHLKKTEDTLLKGMHLV